MVAHLIEVVQIVGIVDDDAVFTGRELSSLVIELTHQLSVSEVSRTQTGRV